MRDGINRVSGLALAVLSSIALLPLGVVYGRWALGGPMPFHEIDEGLWAHVFQLAIVLMMPTGLAFFTSSNWKDPVRAARPLVFPVVALGIAFAALYFGEHGI